MTEFASLRDAAADAAMQRITRDFERAFQAITGMADNVSEVQQQMWTEIEELRDDVNALSNRIESLRRARLGDGDTAA